MPYPIDSPITSLFSAWVQSQIVKALDYYPQNASAFQTLCAQYLGGPAIIDFHAESAYPVTWCVARNGNKILCALSGVRTTAGGQQLALSWLSAADPPNNVPYVKAVGDWATQVMNASPPLGPFSGMSLHVMGHSLGGAIGLVLASKWKALFGALPVVSSISFGSPKVVGLGGFNQFLNISSIRWATEGDPVPVFPPSITRAPILHGALSSSASIRLLQWSHVVAPATISASGIATFGDTDYTGNDLKSGTVLAAWNGQQGSFGPQHAIAVYELRLFAAYSSAPAPPPVVPAPVAVNIVQPLPTPAQALVAGQTYIAYLEAAKTNEAITPDLPKQVRFAYYRLMKGGAWALTLDGADIGMGPSKRKVQACARHGNRFLSLFQGIGQAYGSAFVTALTSYLEKAADPASGFKPTLMDTDPIPPMSIFGL